MSYIIVNVGTDRAYGKNSYSKNTYETERGAKGACTKLNKAADTTEQWKVMSVAEYNARPVKMVERVNLMSGLKYMEAEDTPNFCSPASESYYSM